MPMKAAAAIRSNDAVIDSAPLQLSLSEQHVVVRTSVVIVSALVQAVDEPERETVVVPMIGTFATVFYKNDRSEGEIELFLLTIQLVKPDCE
jgi:hypothetical protein